MNSTDTQDDFIAKNPHLKDFLPFLDQLNKESHRGAVLIACSYIEELLGKIIGSFLIETKQSNTLLEGFNAPLGSFSSRAVAALCLGLITEQEAKEIDVLRKIRNIFAHDFKASFHDQNLSDLCSSLTFSAKNYGTVVIDCFGQFNTAAVSVILHLTNRPHYVSKKRLASNTWPY